jgi:enoyl-[acyl-carrier protein] reductase II
MYPEIETLMSVIEEERVGIVFTSAGNPETWTGWLKERGIIVAHVISSMRFAKKAEAAGVHAVVAEGFEAGGHNGREETTTFCLVPMVRDAVQVPVIAAGGISSGRAMLAAMALGADGVQIGSRFAAAKESSAHPAFKQAVINADEGDTKLSLKKLAPVRLLRNTFAQKVEEAELNGADKAGLLTLLGHGRAKSGMFDGDLEHGELEIGQVSAMIREIQPAAAIVEEIWKEFLSKKEQLENNIR